MAVTSRILLALVVTFLFSAAPAMAQDAAEMAKIKASAPKYHGLGAGVGMGISVLGIGVGLGLIGFAALSGIARQPEQASKIQGAMFILAGLVEGAGILSLLLCLVLGAGWV